jgi:hypothetical protein
MGLLRDGFVDGVEGVKLGKAARVKIGIAVTNNVRALKIESKIPAY